MLLRNGLLTFVVFERDGLLIFVVFVRNGPKSNPVGKWDDVE